MPRVIDDNQNFTVKILYFEQWINDTPNLYQYFLVGNGLTINKNRIVISVYQRKFVFIEHKYDFLVGGPVEYSRNSRKT